MYGARSTLELTRKHSKSGLRSSPPAMSATRPCCPNFSTRSRPIRRSAASPPTVPSTPASAMMPSPLAALRPSYHPAKMPNHGSPIHPVLRPGPAPPRTAPRPHAERPSEPGFPPLDHLVPDCFGLLRRHARRVGLEAAPDLLAGLHRRIPLRHPPLEPVNSCLVDGCSHPPPTPSCVAVCVAKWGAKQGARDIERSIMSGKTMFYMDN